MPASSKEYHEQANCCLALVREASSHLTKAQLEYLAQTWMNLADVGEHHWNQQGHALAAREARGGAQTSRVPDLGDRLNFSDRGAILDFEENQLEAVAHELSL